MLRYSTRLYETSMAKGHVSEDHRGIEREKWHSDRANDLCTEKCSAIAKDTAWSASCLVAEIGMFPVPN